MLLKIRRFAIASAIVIPAVAGLSMATAATAGAAPAAHFAVHASPLIVGPNSNITGSGAAVVYSPHKLKNLTAVSSADCSTSDYTFSIANTTTKTQKVTFMGSLAFKLPAGEQEDICVFADGTLKFGLEANPAAKLKAITTM
jgi:hypothetical protein